MSHSRRQRGDGARLRLVDALFCFAILAGLANFCWHALQGEFGLFALIRIESEERALAAELADLRAERARLENLTHRLSGAYLDLDLLDERARAVLGHMRSDEIVLR